MELLLSDVISHSLISASLCDCNEGRCRTFHTNKLHNTVATCVMMLEVQQCTLNLYSVTAGETEEMLSVEPNYLNWAEICAFLQHFNLGNNLIFFIIVGGNIYVIYAVCDSLKSEVVMKLKLFFLADERVGDEFRRRWEAHSAEWSNPQSCWC